MTNPVQRNQNFTMQLVSSHLSQTQASGPNFQDTLQIRELAQNSSVCSKAWKSITDFVKSIFKCLFGRSAVDPKTRIQEIAARDHFLWFYTEQQNPLTAFMGNFHLCKIQLWGLQFECAESAFQAAKFRPNIALMQQFQGLHGDAAFRLARQLTQNWTPNQHAHWRANNRDAMHEVLHAKFSQNPQLKELLLATGSAYLVEHIPVKGRDAFWGDDSDGTGQNWLGIKLMETRRNLGGGAPVTKNAQYNAFLQR